MPKSPKIVIPIEADIAEAKKRIEDIEKKLSKAGKSGGGALGKLKQNALGVAAGFAASGAAIGGFINITGGFEQAIANVQAVSGDTKKELSALAREMGATTVFSAKEAADAMFFLSSAGLKVNEQAQVLPNVLNAAAAAQIGLAEASDLTVNLLKTFNLGMEQSGPVVDALVKTTQSANTDLTQLGQALEDVGGIAASLGAPINDISAILGAMADQGLKGGKAGQQLRQALARLAKPTAAAETVLKKYGITTDELTKLLPTPIALFKRLNGANLSTADAIEVLGVRQTALFNTVKTGIPNIERLSTALEDSAGAAGGAAAVQLDTLQGSMKLLNSAFQELLISGSEDGGLNEMISDLVEFAILAVQGFQGMPGPLKAVLIGVVTLVPAVLALNAAFGPLGLIMAGVAAGIIGISAALGAFPAQKITQIDDATRALHNLKKEITEIDKGVENFKKGKVIDFLKESGAKLEDFAGSSKKVRDAFKQFFEGKINEKELLSKFKGAKELIEITDASINALQRRMKKLTAPEVDLNQTFRPGILGDEAVSEQGGKDSAAEIEKIIGKLKAYKEELKKIGEENKKKPLTPAGGGGEKTGDGGLAERIALIKKGQEIGVKSFRAAVGQYAKIEKLATDLTAEQIQKRIDLRNLEIENMTKGFEAVASGMQGIFDLVGAGFDRFIQNGLNTRNEASEQIAAMDAEDRARETAKLEDELSLLRKKDDAASQAQAADLQRTLDRRRLEDESAAREKQIAIQRSQIERKRAAAEKAGAILQIGISTAASIAKAVALSPLTGGMPWAGINAALGAVQMAAAIAAPLPPVISAAQGGSMVTNGLTSLIVGDNPSGRELVTVTPMGGEAPPLNGGTGSPVTVMGDIIVPVQNSEEQFAKNLGRYVQLQGRVRGG